MKKYLGKNLGQTKVLLGNISTKVKLKGIILVWFLPLLAFGFLGLNYGNNKTVKLTSTSSDSQNISNKNQTTISSNGARILAETTPPADPTKVCTTVSNQLFLEAKNSGVPTFPLIPNQFLDSGVNECNPARWNFDVFNYLAYKFLAILYFVSYVMTILLTIIAGIYYISGFANEANVKKGKSILISTYVGLLIVMLARLILFGSFNLITGKQVTRANISGSSQGL